MGAGGDKRADVKPESNDVIASEAWQSQTLQG